ncbi:PPPDE peptidase domain containing protein 2 [Echinococcus multilocularis]|uniref:PPPDE peptidase domain containing protein 2 n=1 Tax=Echinococcus multilocularis TaxID=6211 RepID=A0A068Y4E1_ECHMU|nr:PPPDE peptidase domain containing protein 2 [Echinococcus multilocularis]
MTDVYLFIYDLSMGLSKLMSQALVGKQFDGIWHTSVVVYNREYFFGQEGISCCSPGLLQTGQLVERKPVGRTRYTDEELRKYINALSQSLFKPGSYELLKHNCNTFSAHLVRHLTGQEIPAYITNLPSDFLETPHGSVFRGVLEGTVSVIGPSTSHIPMQTGVLHRQSLSTTIRPILFDEPLSFEFSPGELSTMFSESTGIALQWANSALPYLLKLSSPQLDSADVPIEALRLLRFNRWATFRQCKAICEVFRLAVWRSPELILTCLTDPNESLHKLPNTYPSPTGQISPSNYFDLDAAKSHLLCNVFALSYDWDLTTLPFVPLEPVAALCIRLIRCQDDETQSNGKYLEKSPEHEMAGLALTVNFAMCPLANESEAMEVAASLFHLLSVKKCFKYPFEALYALKAIHALIGTFPSIADLAKTLEIVNYIPELQSQVELIEGDVEASPSYIGTLKAIVNEITSILNN